MSRFKIILAPIQWNDWTVFFLWGKNMDRIIKFKKVISFFCISLLLSMSIFMSYNRIVHAEDDYDLKDSIEDIINIALVAGGIASIPASGGLTALGFLSIVGGVLGATDSMENIYDYITDNGDGTYTINEEFVQAVLDAAEKLEEQGFTDKDIIKQKNDRYDLHYEVVCSEATCFQHYDKVTIKYEGLIFMNGFAACLITSSSEVGYYVLHLFYADNSIHLVEYQRAVYSCGVVLNGSNMTLKGQTFGANVPIFSDVNSLNAYLSNGTGYKDALNYRETPLFRRHSVYTPTYTGGSVTVNRTVIENINQKIAEVDSDESLTDDQKIELLKQYIFSGGTSGTIGNGSGSYPGDTDYDDNKDLPSGTDLSDTNSWLKKIYLKVCQIYDRMNTAVVDAEQAALAKIQESLDEIIEQLKKIKHWTAVDTVIDGVDAVADWLDLIRDVLTDGAGSAVTALSSALQDSTDLMKQKFPFSIPWDILFLVSALSAEPETPQFSIPFNFEISGLDLVVDYQMELDFTHLQWFSDLSRLLLSMTYAAGLMKKTVDIVSANKEG